MLTDAHLLKAGLTTLRERCDVLAKLKKAGEVGQTCSAGSDYTQSVV